MTPDDSGDVTLLLRASREGDRAAFDRMLPMVHAELGKLARRQLRKLRPGQTLDTVALVNEAYLRLVDDVAVEWQDRCHFFAVTSRVMRWIVVDHVRQRAAQKRGAGVVIATLDPELVGDGSDRELVLAVDRAIEELAVFNERLARVVECRFFLGMTEEEVAAALDISLRSVQRDWLRARTWLRRLLAGPDHEPA